MRFDRKEHNDEILTTYRYDRLDGRGGRGRRRNDVGGQPSDLETLGEIAVAEVVSDEMSLFHLVGVGTRKVIEASVAHERRQGLGRTECGRHPSEVHRVVPSGGHDLFARSREGALLAGQWFDVCKHARLEQRLWTGLEIADELDGERTGAIKREAGPYGA